MTITIIKGKSKEEWGQSFPEVTLFDSKSGRLNRSWSGNVSH